MSRPIIKRIRGARLAWAGAALALAAVAGCSNSMATGPTPDMEAALKIREGFSAASGKEGKAATAAAGPQLKRLAGWTTVKGRFVVNGSVPPAKPIDITKDHEFCGQHSLFNESIVIGKDNGLANVVIFVRTAKIPINKEYDKTATAQVIMDNHFCRFDPHVQKVRIGQTLTIHNSDLVAHNSKLDGRNLQGNPLLASGATADFKIEAPESAPVPISCSIHNWMHGRVVVTSNPYCAISAKDGSFELADLPAGDLELEIWQESAAALPVKNAGLEAMGQVGRYKISLEPGKVKDLGNIVVAAATLKAS